jgi:hypothetical protein
MRRGAGTAKGVVPLASAAGPRHSMRLVREAARLDSGRVLNFGGSGFAGQPRRAWRQGSSRFCVTAAIRPSGLRPGGGLLQETLRRMLVADDRLRKSVARAMLRRLRGDD